MSSTTISPEQLSAAIQEELGVYGDSIRDGVDKEAEKAIKKLVSDTKAAAPVGHRGKFKRAITYVKGSGGVRSPSYVWGAKAPEHRLVHLLVHGHATRDGRRVGSKLPLASLLSEAEKEFEAGVRRIIEHG